PNDPRDHGMALLASLSLKFAGDERRSRDFLEDAAVQFPRPSLWYDMARFYIDGGFDGRIIRAVQDEDDLLLRTRMQFYLAGQYEVLGSVASARSLYLEIRDGDMQGFSETRLAAHRYERMSTAP
ncbi:MAG: hypothetical protein MI724_14440, partial [Spirochaetales bacterium]|nr:hypothetical protein [Spirochaetales bacterium]